MANKINQSPKSQQLSCQDEEGLAKKIQFLASTAEKFARKGQLEEAASTLEDAYRTQLSFHGKYHVWTADILRDMALLKESQGKIERANQQFQEATNIYRHVLGPGHLRTLELENKNDRISSGSSAT